MCVCVSVCVCMRVRVSFRYNGVLQTSLTGSHSLSNGVNLVASATSTGLLGLDVTSKVSSCTSQHGVHTHTYTHTQHVNINALL